MFAGSGNDVVLLGNGRDTGFGGSGDDLIDGGAGRDKIFGGSGNDILKGGAGNDKIFGGRGDDMIYMGTGRDTAFGGSGSDTFVFNEHDGRDKIIGFNVHQDVIDLSDFGLSGMDDLHISGGWFNTTLNLGGGDSLNLWYVNPHSLSEDNFVF